MEKKKISKLVIQKETISNLSKFEKIRVLGGYGTTYEYGAGCWHTQKVEDCITGPDYTPDPCNNTNECCGTETCICPEGLYSVR